MTDPPKIAPGDWLNVGQVRCVVKTVYKAESKNGVCLVVCNKDKPTTRDVDWDGEQWIFPARPDFGGYGRQSDPYVQQLIGKR